MKKYFIIAVAALIASVACTKTEKAPEADQLIPVTFQVANYEAQTKATSLLSESISSFQSQAFLHAQGVDLTSEGAVNGTSYQNFFMSASPWVETVSWDASAKQWAPAATYYWPKGSQSFVNFVSWYNGGGANPTISYAYTASKWTVSLNWTKSSIAANENLLYADVAWRQNANLSTYHIDDASVVGVPTLFHHALSQVNLKAYVNNAAGDLTLSSNLPADSNTKWTVTIKNVAIGSVAVGGTLSMTNADPGSKTTQAWTSSGWTSPVSGSLTNSSNVSANTITKNTAVDVLANQSVIPQSLSGVKLTFDVDIVATYNNGTTHHEVLSQEVDMSTFGPGTWAENTKYTYYIKINPSQNEVLYDPAVESDWTEYSPAPEQTI